MEFNRVKPLLTTNVHVIVILVSNNELALMTQLTHNTQVLEAGVQILFYNFFVV
jgi:hypothetical protein